MIERCACVLEDGSRFGERRRPETYRAARIVVGAVRMSSRASARAVNYRVKECRANVANRPARHQRGASSRRIRKIRRACGCKLSRLLGSRLVDEGRGRARVESPLSDFPAAEEIRRRGFIRQRLRPLERIRRAKTG